MVEKITGKTESNIEICHYHLYHEEVFEKTGYPTCERFRGKLFKVINNLLGVGYNVQIIQKDVKDEKIYLIYVSNKSFRQR